MPKLKVENSISTSPFFFVSDKKKLPVGPKVVAITTSPLNLISDGIPEELEQCHSRHYPIDYFDAWMLPSPSEDWLCLQSIHAQIP